MEIEDVVKRFPDLAFRFAFFKSDTADRIAEKYLRNDVEREQYKRVRLLP